MKKLKHSKLKNTAVLYELLLIRLTSDILSENDSKVYPIIKKYFNKNSPLVTELRLYKAFANNYIKNESNAQKLIEALIKAHKKLNNKELIQYKYNLVKTIKENFNDEFFQIRLDNYKVYATTYKLFEYTEDDNPLDYTLQKQNLLEILTSELPDKLNISENLVNGENKHVKALTYKFLVEKFNKKYDILGEDQKRILKYYISNATDSPKLKKFTLKEATNIKNILSKATLSISDTTTKIKLKEITNMLDGIKEVPIIKENHIISLLKYYEIVNELKGTK